MFSVKFWYKIKTKRKEIAGGIGLLTDPQGHQSVTLTVCHSNLVVEMTAPTFFKLFSNV